MTARLVLFDIDGTLLLTGGAGLRAMRSATLELFGERFLWDGMDTSGGLDPLLFAEAARRSGLEVSPADHDAFRDRYIERLSLEIERSGPEARAMPGVHAVLDLLHSMAGLTLGLLTGNYATAAAIKLRSVGIDPARFAVAVYGDEAPTRPAMGALALRRLGASRGAILEPRRVLVVGDTPRDVHCARENGFLSFGVGTGRFRPEELLAAGAHAAVPDLTTPGPLLHVLGLEPGTAP